MGRLCTSLSFDAFLDTVLGMRYEGQAGSCLSGGDKMRIRYHSFFLTTEFSISLTLVCCLQLLQLLIVFCDALLSMFFF